MSNDQPMAQAAEERQSPGVAGKKAYHTPRLENYGEVRELTRTDTVNGYVLDFSTSGPMYYTST